MKLIKHVDIKKEAITNKTIPDRYNQILFQMTLLNFSTC